MAVLLTPDAQLTRFGARLLGEAEARYAKLKLSKSPGLPFGAQTIRPSNIPTSPHQQTSIQQLPKPPGEDYLAASGISLSFGNVCPAESKLFPQDERLVVPGRLFASSRIVDNGNYMYAIVNRIGGLHAGTCPGQASECRSRV